MVSLQFLNLPWLPQERIIRNLTPIDIFNFSLISKRSHALAKCAKINFELARWTFEHEKLCFSFNRHHNSKSYFFRVKKRNTAIQCPKAYHAKIDGVHFSLNIVSKRTIKIVCNSEKDRKDPSQVIAYRLLELIRVGAFKCDSTMCKIPSYVFNFTRNFEYLSINAGVTLTHEEARFLLEDITVDRLTLYCSVREGFLHSKPITHRKVILRYAPWFTEENLMNNNCETLHVGETNMTSVGLSRFFRKWKSGGFPRLRGLIISNNKNIVTLEEGPLNAEGDQVLKEINGNTGVLELDGTSIRFFVGIKDVFG